MRTAEIVVETELPASPAVAFATLADPSTRRIDPAVRTYQPDTDPMGLGTRIRIRTTILHLPVRAESVVTSWEPGRRVVVEAIRPRWPFLVEAEHRFTPTSRGCTYAWRITATSTGPPGTLLVAPFLRAMRTDATAQQGRFAALLLADADPLGHGP